MLLIGADGGTHVGGSLRRAAAKLGLPVEFCDTGSVEHGSWLRQKLRRAFGSPPVGTRKFSERVVAACEAQRPALLLATGFAPITSAALEQVRRLGAHRACWLTDDPWNAALRARWFLDVAPHYDTLFTPRRANQAQLARLAARVQWLPFAYDEALFFPEPGPAQAGSELLFVGGADAARRPIIDALVAAGIEPALFGGYWDRFRSTRRFARGLADPAAIRQATTAARVSLCLVRRANRDGHVMRSYEIPACAGVPLVEDTEDHRALFGEEGEAAFYFGSTAELVAKARALLQDVALRSRLAAAALARVRAGANTYGDRLATMLAAAAP